MTVSAIVYANSTTRILTVADVRDFVRLCEQDDIPDDAVVRVLTTGARSLRHGGDRRISQLAVRRSERLAEEKNEPAVIRSALDLPPTASSDEVLDRLAEIEEGVAEAAPAPSAPTTELQVQALARINQDFGKILGIEQGVDEQAIDYLNRLITHVGLHFAGEHFGPEHAESPRNDRVLADLLSLVEVTVSPATVNTWTDKQYDQAEQWAAATHLSASDNDVSIPQRPAFLPKGI
jgi:hypothetical protein